MRASAVLKVAFVLSLATVIATGQMLQGCTSDDEGEPTCQERFDKDSREFTACRFVEILNEMRSKYEDTHTLATEITRKASAEKVFVNNSLYEEWFSTTYHTYEEVLSWFKNDVTVDNYDPKGARFEKLTVKSEQQNTPGAKGTVPSCEGEVTLDNGRGFPILKMVEIEHHWYILTLMHVF